MIENYRQTVRAVIVKNGEIYSSAKVIRGDMTIVFPGGGIEKGDTEEETIKKECLEEAGIAVKDLVRLKTTTRITANEPFTRDNVTYIGTDSVYYMAEFHKRDTRYYDIEGDGLKGSFLPINVVESNIANLKSNILKKDKLVILAEVRELLGLRKQRTDLLRSW